jgi:hypothetical protein
MREMQLEAERKRKREDKKRKEKEKTRKEKEAREARERVEAARGAIRNQAKKLGWMVTEHGPNKFFVRKPNSNDILNIEILKSGVVRAANGLISMINHANADAFYRNLASTLKGTWKVWNRSPAGGAHVHAHAHDHVHHS